MTILFTFSHAMKVTFLLQGKYLGNKIEELWGSLGSLNQPFRKGIISCFGTCVQFVIY